MKTFLSGQSELFDKIFLLNPVVFNFVGEPVNNFTRFTLVGRQVQAVMCLSCNSIDGDFGSRNTIDLMEYDAHHHQCISEERRNHQVRVKIKVCIYLQK